MHRLALVLGLSIIALLVACGGTSTHVLVELEGGRTLREWDSSQLEKVEPQTQLGPKLLNIIDISLRCADYEDDKYEFIDACRSVPSGAVTFQSPQVVIWGSGTSTTFTGADVWNLGMVTDITGESIDLIGTTGTETDVVLQRHIMDGLERVTVTLP